MINKNAVKLFLKRSPYIRDYLLRKRIRNQMCKHNVDESLLNENKAEIKSIPNHGGKSNQIKTLLNKVRIKPIDSKIFFYSLDCFKSMTANNLLLINYTIDYSVVVNSCLNNITHNLLKISNKKFAEDELIVIDAIKDYIQRCDNLFNEKYNKSIEAIKSFVDRPANSFFEGLQRILFFNQLLWQTDHKHNGFGRLDLILGDLYVSDIEKGIITKNEASEMIDEFFRILHEYYWYKSGMLLGDTGQIIILGGKNEDGTYFYNELTYLFIEESMKLKLPDPKVFLRYSENTPDDLLELALKCIATGIGAPFLSNDDKVIPAMLSYGYDEKNAYDYCASACWEPLAIHSSADLNNICAFNFAIPFEKVLDSKEFCSFNSLCQVIEAYKVNLREYINSVLTPLESLEFEVDPLITITSQDSIAMEKDITRGGAQFSNLGLTSIGIASVVDSLINIDKLVFKEKKYTLNEINIARKNNYKESEELLKCIESADCYFGRKDDTVTEMVDTITDFVNTEFDKYRTKYNGKFKFGLSSPFYITDSEKIDALVDGRLANQPFSVHISSRKKLEITELMHFAASLNYTESRLNGNVVDFFIAPSQIENNLKKYITLVRKSFEEGVFQMQMNVIDSKTLIDAKMYPEKYSSLVVRVWGFSAYFVELPESYQEVLIKRAKEAENAA